MFCGILKECRRFGPVLDAPVFKVPFVHVVVAFVVHIIEDAVLQDEVGGEIVDVGVGRVQQAAHGPDLFQAGLGQAVLQDHFVDRLPFNVLFHDALVFPVHIQHFRHGDADLRQPAVVGQLGRQLVPKLVVIAGLVVDLLEGDGSAVICLRQPGITALAFAQQFEKGVFFSVDRHGFFHTRHLPCGFTRRRLPGRPGQRTRRRPRSSERTALRSGGWSNWA